MEIIKCLEDLLGHTKKQATKPEDIQIVYRKSSNLKDFIISGYINTSIDRPITQPCMRPGKSCEIMRTTNVTTTNYRVSYKIRGNFNCLSENVEYALTCKQHGLKDIGETSTALTKRLRNHVSAIKHDQNNPVAKHFNETHHENIDFYIEALDREMDKN